MFERAVHVRKCLEGLFLAPTASTLRQSGWGASVRQGQSPLWSNPTGHRNQLPVARFYPDGGGYANRPRGGHTILFGPPCQVPASRVRFDAGRQGMRENHVATLAQSVGKRPPSGDGIYQHQSCSSRDPEKRTNNQGGLLRDLVMRRGIDTAAGVVCPLRCDPASVMSCRGLVVVESLFVVS